MKLYQLILLSIITFISVYFVTFYFNWFALIFTLSLIFFIITIFIKKSSSKFVLHLLIVLSPTYLLYSITSVYAAFDGTPYTLPLIIIAPLGVLFGIITSKLLKHKLIIGSVFILLLLFISFLLYPNWLLYVSDKENPINKDFPNEELVLKNANGDLVDLSKQKGKIIVLDLWSSTCGVCFEKFPEFEEEKNNYMDNPNILFYSLNLKLKKDNRINVLKFTDKYTFNTLYADTNTWKVLENNSVPKLIIINKNFKIVYKGRMNHKWYEFYNNFNSIIKNLLNE